MVKLGGMFVMSAGLVLSVLIVTLMIDMREFLLAMIFAVGVLSSVWGAMIVAQSD